MKARTILFLVLATLSFGVIFSEVAFAADCTWNGQVVPCEQAKGSVMTGFALVGSIIVLVLGLSIHWVVMLVHALANPIENKLVWVLVILFTGLIGSLAYHFIERKSFQKKSASAQVVAAA